MTFQHQIHKIFVPSISPSDIIYRYIQKSMESSDFMGVTEECENNTTCNCLPYRTICLTLNNIQLVMFSVVDIKGLVVLCMLS